MIGKAWTPSIINSTTCIKVNLFDKCVEQGLKKNHKANKETENSMTDFLSNFQLSFKPKNSNKHPFQTDTYKYSL